MLRSLNSLQKSRLTAVDGEIGDIHDFLFTDDKWMIRYMVVDTGRWLPGRKVLLAPAVLGQSMQNTNDVPVNLTCDQIRTSPPIETDRPLSRQKELALHRHYGWPAYWGPWPITPLSVYQPAAIETVADDAPPDTHLRSFREIMGYHFEATDGAIGHVEDILADDINWSLQYFVADTRNWLPGKRALVPPERFVGPISWSDERVNLDLTKEQIRQSPPYDPAVPVSPAYEMQLRDYYRDSVEAWRGVPVPPANFEKETSPVTATREKRIAPSRQ